MINKEELDRKYAKLLLTKCLNFNHTNFLMIEYRLKEHSDFVNIIIDEAKKIGVKRIETWFHDKDEVYNYLKNTKLEDIKINPLIDATPLSKAALEGACILHINTFVPNEKDDIEFEKTLKSNKIFSETLAGYRKYSGSYGFPWTICAYPNKRWAEFLFKNTDDAYMKLYNYIIQMCMVDRDDPIKAWDDFIKESNYYKEYLQSLNISKLHYQNSLGTDFEIGLPKNTYWMNMDKRSLMKDKIMVNMPSYEIFTTPDFKTANGIVYNSRPFVFSGKVIDDFHIEFKDGKAINYEAKVGNDTLKSIIEDYKNACYLGEVALVNNNSPISNTGIIFYDTLFDENASCHLALGNGKAGNIINGDNLSKEELDKLGINRSKVHVDFMIGTDDLEIEALTNQGKKLVFKRGNFVL